MRNNRYSRAKLRGGDMLNSWRRYMQPFTASLPLCVSRPLSLISNKSETFKREVKIMFERAERVVCAEGGRREEKNESNWVVPRMMWNVMYLKSTQSIEIGRQSHPFTLRIPLTTHAYGEMVRKLSIMSCIRLTQSSIRYSNREQWSKRERNEIKSQDNILTHLVTIPPTERMLWSVRMWWAICRCSRSAMRCLCEIN